MTQLDRLFAALADPSRRAIFQALVGQPKSVGDVAAGFPISRPAVSQHLKLLQEAGLVTCRSEGTRNIYSAEASGMALLKAYFDDLWEHSLINLKALAESTRTETEE